MATLLNERRDAGSVAKPRVLLNCACSLDGKIAAPDGHPMPLSDDLDLRRVHLLLPSPAELTRYEALLQTLSDKRGRLDRKA